MPLHELYQMSKQNLDHKDISNSHTLPSSSTIVNFSHFAKPVAIVKANLQNIGLSSSRSESVGVRNKDEAVTVSNPCKLTKIDLSGECLKKSVISCHQAVDPSTVDLKYSEAKYPEQEADVSRPACKEDVSKVDRTSNQVLGESGRNGQEDVVKCMEPAEVSSSVCSENGAYRGSDDPNQNLKGKNIYSEDSEDDDNESVGIKRMARGRGGFGSKRNRSAEVHNLSERRRRDTINEKMRTLQELIPNCNKTDNASMLDEAIKYLKTLQLQLQIMSMAGGALYRPLMLPAGMQHMLMSPFSAMSVSMKMGLGVPQFQGTHLPVANPQMFGLPGQGLMPMPCAPMFSYPRESAINSLAVGLNANGTAGFMETVGLASKLKDPMPNVNSQVMQNNNDHNSANPMSIQCEPTIGGAEQSNLVLNTGRVSSTDYTLGNEDSPVIDKSNE